MKRPDTVEREYLEKLEKRLMYDNEAFRIISSLYLSENKANDECNNDRKDRVGIWKRVENHYELDESMAEEWNYWSKAAVIPEKSDKTRIVFLGESVARGYLYDPMYNPCSELSNLFQNMKSNQFEVIDLARTDLNYAMLNQVVKESIQLDPDIVVIFAGNNWDCNDLWETNNLEIVNRLEHGGMKAVLQFFNETLKKQVKNLYQNLEDYFTSRDVPVIFIIPEFNLMDWEDTMIGLPWGVSADDSAWLANMNKLETLLNEGKYQQVIEQSLAFSTLDEKLSTKELYLLANAYKGMGNHEMEQLCRRKAKDVTILYPKISTPRTVSALQDALRLEAKEYKKIYTIDAGGIFRNQSEWMDRKFFMDYCHLSLYGIQLVMAQVYTKILDLFHVEGAGNVSPVELILNINHRVLAEAHFLAAVHNAHWGQKGDIVEYHLQKACEYDSEMKTVIKEFLMAQSRTLPIWMSQNAKDYLNHISEQRQRYLGKNKGLRLDMILTECAKRVLAEDQEFLSQINSSIEHAYGFHGKSINLLETDHYVDAISMLEAQFNWSEVPNKLKRYGFYAAYDKVSKFYFVSQQKENHTLSLLCRMSGTQVERGALVLYVNGKKVNKFMVDVKWTKIEVDITADLLCNGYNEICLLWSDYHENIVEQMGRVVEDLTMRKVPDILPIYGNIYTMKLKA